MRLIVDPHPRPVRRWRAAVLSAVVLVACAGPPAGAPAPMMTRDPGPIESAAPANVPPELMAAVRLPPPPREPEPLAAFGLNLYRDGDFVPQYTFEWCVGASMQMTLNMIDEPNSTSRDDQERLWTMARNRSSDQWGGASGRGWVAVLNGMGAGPYKLTGIPDYEDALRDAAFALRTTGRPVGLIMWRGRHAWVMSGFESLGDPAVDEDFVVTGVHVLDPLYPHGDATWGPSPEPNTLLTPDELARQYKARDKRSWTYDSPTGYVMILPVAATGQD
jgi:hypothetical protein